MALVATPVATELVLAVVLVAVVVAIIVRLVEAVLVMVVTPVALAVALVVIPVVVVPVLEVTPVAVLVDQKVPQPVIRTPAQLQVTREITSVAESRLVVVDLVVVRLVTDLEAQVPVVVLDLEIAVQEAAVVMKIVDPEVITVVAMEPEIVRAAALIIMMMIMMLLTENETHFTVASIHWQGDLVSQVITEAMR